MPSIADWHQKIRDHTTEVNVASGNRPGIRPSDPVRRASAVRPHANEPDQAKEADHVGAVEIAINRVSNLVARLEAIADTVERNADRLCGPLDQDESIGIKESEGAGQVGLLLSRIGMLEVSMLRAERQVRRLAEL